MGEQCVYKIRKANGLFSSGGSEPRFTKKGKVWGSLGALKQHLALFSNFGMYEGCEVVAFEYIETEATPVNSFVQDVREARKKREQAIRERTRLAKENREKAMLALLQKKYGVMAT